MHTQESLPFSTPSTSLEEVSVHVSGVGMGWPGPGAWVALLTTTRNGKTYERLLSGRHDESNPHLMTVVAMVEALKHLKRPVSVRLHTSQQWMVRNGPDFLAMLTHHLPENYDADEVHQIVEAHDVRCVWIGRVANDRSMNRVRTLASSMLSPSP